MPIKGRIEMLSTGFRTPIGMKISGADIKTIEEIGAQVESELQSVKGTRSIFAERTGSGYFLDFAWDRNALAIAMTCPPGGRQAEGSQRNPIFSLKMVQKRGQVQRSLSLT